MMGYRWAMVAIVAAQMAVGAAAQPMPQDPIAAANIAQCQRYEALVHSNPTFRAKRIAEECDPINDPQLHAQCVASFGPAPDTPARPQQR